MGCACSATPPGGSPRCMRPFSNDEARCASPLSVFGGSGEPEPECKRLVEKRAEHEIPPVSRDPEVSAARLCCVAAVRTLVLALVLGAALAALVSQRHLSIAEAAKDDNIVLSLDFCAQDGPVLLSSGVNPQGFHTLLEKKQVKVMNFVPRGQAATDLKLPTLSFYQSEEYLAKQRESTMGYSLGAFMINEHTFGVHLEGEEQDIWKCLGELTQSHDMIAEDMPAVQFFAQAVNEALEQAKRRTPHAWVMSTPSAHGALLLWRGPERMWTATEGRFEDAYAPSPAWVLYNWFTIVLRIALTVLVVLLSAKFAYGQWQQALDIWVVQYDYLWEEASDGVLDDRAGEEGSVGGIGSTFVYKYQACSLFFIFDHLVGDPQENTENLLKGVLSALVDGLLMVLVSALPIFHGLFFHDWKAPTYFLVALTWVVGLLFGAAYFFAVPFRWREPLFKAHMLLMLAVTVYGVAYFCSIAVFIVTRLIVEPAEVCQYAIGLGTIILVGIIAVQRLMVFREALKKRLSGKSSRGAIIANLRRMGLDLRSIFFTVVGLIIVVCLVAAVCVLAGMLHFKSSPFPDMVMSVVTPIAGFVGTVQMIQKKREQMDHTADNITGETLNIL